MRRYHPFADPIHEKHVDYELLGAEAFKQGRHGHVVDMSRRGGPRSTTRVRVIWAAIEADERRPKGPRQSAELSSNASWCHRKGARMSCETYSIHEDQGAGGDISPVMRSTKSWDFEEGGGGTDTASRPW